MRTIGFGRIRFCMATPGTPDIVEAARARREELNRQIETLTRDVAELDAFLATAARIQAQLNLGPHIMAAPPKKAGRKDVVAAAVHLLRKVERAVSTGEVVDALQGMGFQIGTPDSNASSIVSANLSAAPEIARNPDGPGWVESEAGKML